MALMSQTASAHAAIDTIDVSRPPPPKGIKEFASALGDVAFAVLLVLLFAFALIVAALPFGLLLWAAQAVQRLF